MAQPEVAFRWSISKTFLVVVALSAPATVATIAVIEGGDFDIGRMVAAVMCGALITFLQTLMAASALKVYIGTQGLRACDVWGTYHELHWSELKSIRAMNVFGLRHLRLHSSATTAIIWLPLFLADAQRFTDLVTQYAGPENELAIYLREMHFNLVKRESDAAAHCGAWPCRNGDHATFN